MAQEGTYNKDYHKYLVEFMSFRDSYKYLKNQLFTESQLLTIVPDDISRWMRYKAFGDATVSMLTVAKLVHDKQITIKL